MTLRRNCFTVASLLMIVIRAFSVHMSSCYRTEYQTGSACCPMCPAGSRVKTDCTEFRSTSCVPCVAGTVMEKLNGLKRCHPCTTCDPGSGLKEKSPCTLTSDTTCEPVEGFFCIDSTSHGCVAAQKHKSCEPGQCIGEKGTASTDIHCSDCRNGTFANGTMAFCQPYAKCETGSRSRQELVQLTQIVEENV
ncbi:tumor necrosis factor receptor superfamily member 14-like isoform X2 [Cololabis saira]|uniref:tumor necrosis factor receptor superfamily member 14-like isoform X2 n=1 Tax=Cololabis saira TaxID=129043 RepID=UPI002AD2AABD|nr:tumor necrosis factor receptor superfamily member 14-like isoform X2 [Cololabis saira]XP_061590750.1 tumor necrosis factor receptor superfamily member 14-like isoform X2 [Cololabis saira]